MVTQAICRYEERLAADAKKDKIAEDWKHVALIIDRILLFIFIALNLGVTVGLMFHAWINGTTVA